MSKRMIKVAALILSVLIMCESVSAAEIKEAMSLFIGVVQRDESPLRDETLSPAAFYVSPEDEVASGTSNEFCISEDAEHILNSYYRYSELSYTEKRILNYGLGVREDTMELLEKEGYNLRGSVGTALIMQRMDFDMYRAEKMLDKMGEEKALAVSAEYMDLKHVCAFWENDISAGKYIAELMANGSDSSSALTSYIIQCNRGTAGLEDNVATGSAAYMNKTSYFDSLSISDIAQKYGLDKNMLALYANESDEDITEEVLNAAEKLGIQVQSEEEESEEDSTKLKGPFIAGESINDSINYSSGAVIYHEKLVSLPGINGSNLELTLNYDSSTRYRYDDYGTEVYKNDNDIWDWGFTRLTNELGGNISTGYKGFLSCIRLSDGSVYDLDGRNGYYVPGQYGYNNIKIYKDNDSSFKTPSGTVSAYYVEYTGGIREYFDAKGRFIGSKDRFGNTVIFDRKSDTESEITDTVGRKISIASAISPSSKTVTVTYPDGSSSKLIFSKFKLSDYNYIWKLDKKDETINGTMLETTYSYGSNLYKTYSETGSEKKFCEVLLKKVTYPTGMSLNYEYNEDERGKNPFWHKTSSVVDHFRYSRITRRYYLVDGNVKDDTEYGYTETNYTGYMPDNFSGEYTYGMTVYSDNGLKTEYTFDENGFNTSVRGYYKYNQHTNDLYVQNMYYDKSGKKYDDETLYYPDPSSISLETGHRIKWQVYKYNDDGLLTEYYSPLSNGAKNSEYKTAYTYNKYGIVSTKTYKQNSSTTITQSNTFTNNDCSIATSVIKVNGSEQARTVYTYNDAGNPLTVKSYTSASDYITTTNTYAANGMLASAKTGDVTESYAYDSMGRIAEMTDGEGGKTSYTYDTMGSLIKMVTPMGRETSYKYDYKANNITLTDPRGNATVYDYDPAGNLLTVKSGGDILESYTYNADMLCETKTAGKGVTHYSYDYLGRVSSVSVKDSSGKAYHTENYFYDGADITKPNTVETENVDYKGVERDIWEDSTLDNSGRVTEKYSGRKGYGSILPDYTYEYDYLDNPVKVSVNLSNVNTDDSKGYAATSYEYNYMGQVTKTTDSLGNTHTYGYDRLGRKTYERDGNNNVRYFDYDALGNLKHTSAPMVGDNYMHTWYYYDKKSRLVKEYTVNNAVGAVETGKGTSYDYDADDELTKITYADDSSDENYVKYSYDANGNRISVNTANGANTTRYEYDKYDRVIKMTDPMGYTENYTYDIVGNMLTKKDRNGNIISYDYDAANRLTKEYSGSTIRAEYTYDMAGNRVIEKNPYSTVKTIYNSNGLPTVVDVTEYDNSGVTFELVNGYDVRKNVTEKRIYRSTSASAGTQELMQYYFYTYDTNGNMTTVKEAGSSSVLAAYGYDGNYNVTSEVYSNGIRNDYSYNKVNLLSGMSVKKGSTVLSGYTYTYYLDGNLQRNVYNLQGKEKKTVEYTYNKADMLVSETSTGGGVTDTYTYTYDKVGNRSSLTASGTENYTTSYKYDDNNRLLREEKKPTNQNRYEFTSYQYDKNGNTLIVKGGTSSVINAGSEGSFGIYTESEIGSTGYTEQKNTYDVFNRLTKTANEDGTSTSYTYYPNDLRLSKHTVKGAANDYKAFLWDGSQTTAELDKNMNVTQLYAFGRGGQRITGKSTATNVVTFYMYNPHGDVQGLINTSGTLTKTYEYDAFGNEIDKDSTDTNPWRYCGEYYDTETEDIYLRNRYYNPSIGRFITEDPARADDNWYSYCNGNPIMFVDSNGLEAYILYNSDIYENPVKIDKEVKKDSISLQKKLGFTEDEVIILSFKNKDEFIKLWGEMGSEDNNSIDAVVIYSHGNSDGLCINNGTGKYKKTETVTSADFKGLNDKEIQTLVLNACETAKEIDGKTNFAQSLAGTINANIVVGANKNVFSELGNEDNILICVGEKEKNKKFSPGEFIAYYNKGKKSVRLSRNNYHGIGDLIQCSKKAVKNNGKKENEK